MFKRSPGHEHEHEARTHKKAETKPISLKKKNPTQNYKWMMLRFGFAE